MNMNVRTIARRWGAALLAILLLAMPLTSCAKKKPEAKPFTYVERTLVDTTTRTSGYYDYRVYDDGTAVILSYTGSESAVVVPDKILEYTVVEIGAGAFSYNTAMTSVVLNPSLELLGAYAFVGCSALTNVQFGEKLWSIGLSALSDTPWYASQVEDFVIVGDGVLLRYQGKDLSVFVPDGVRHICTAFAQNLLLKSVYLPESVVTVGYAAFSDCPSLVHVEMSPNVVLIDQYAFYGCTELSVTRLPDGVVKIGQYAFYDNFMLQALDCGASLRSIDYSAFGNCSQLKMLQIPATLETIDANAFEDCVGLTAVYYGGSEQQILEIKYLNDESSNFRFKDATKFYNVGAK